MHNKRSDVAGRIGGSRAVTRRDLLSGAAAVGVLSATPASAQDNRWWDSIFNGSFTNANQSGERTPRVEPEVNDLRQDVVPWRSDEMHQRMERAVERYLRIVDSGGWYKVPPGRMLRPGDDDERVVALKQRLGQAGMLRGPAGYLNSYSYDDGLEEAVRSFQEQFGLRVTGRVDQPTFAQLNIPAQVRLEQLRLNQRRIRELLQGRMDERYVLVNVPAYQLEAVESFEVRRRHRVIVGKPDRQTPSVKAQIRALNFFPYWRVPDSVAQLDLIPRLRKEPEYLEKERIRAFTPAGQEISTAAVNWNTADAKSVKFRQDPGPQNALGLVRIDMPNEHIVYMHDTPMKPLFAQRVRPFSAGCVRVQNVFELVEWIARNEPGWDHSGRAQEIVDGGSAVDITLTRPIPVHFTYITAWAEGDGVAVFRPDVYGRDGIGDGGSSDPEAPPIPASLAP
jgi:murein L,D-transpeptidase YcbB/YkuD